MRGCAIRQRRAACLALAECQLERGIINRSLWPGVDNRPARCGDIGPPSGRTGIYPGFFSRGSMLLSESLPYPHSPLSFHSLRSRLSSPPLNPATKSCGIAVDKPAGPGRKRISCSFLLKTHLLAVIYILHIHDTARDMP